MIAIVAAKQYAAQAAQAVGVNALSDKKLVEGIASGDVLAMRMLFSRHRLFVYKFIRRIVRDDTTTEDLVSDVFLEVWRRAAAKYEARAAVSTWLMAIARFKCLSERRRRKDVEWDCKTAESIADSADDPEFALQDKEINKILHQCLAKLSPKHGQVIELVYYEDKSVKEIAAMVGVSVPTAKMRIFHARRRLTELVRAA